MDWIDIVGICHLCIGYCILVPTLIYFCYQFNQIDPTADILKHRNIRLVNYMTILSVLPLIIEIPFEIVTNISIIYPSYDFITYITANVFMWCLFILFTIKAWLLYYNFQYHLSLSKLAWKKEINPRYRSWYIINKSKYGNLTYCIRVLIIPFIMWNITQIFLEYMLKTNLFAHSAVILSLLVVIPSFILYKRLKYVTDTFHIKTELFYQQTIISLFMIIMLIKFIVNMIINKSSTNSSSETFVVTMIRIERLLNCIIISIVIFSISLLSTWYPVRLNERASATDSSKYIHTREQSTTFKFGVKPMLQCIADPKGFNAFMKHLVQEFATENMLFVCEYIQIKHDLQAKYKGLIKIKKTEHFGDDILKTDVTNIDPDDEYIVVDFNVINVDQSVFANDADSPPSIIQKMHIKQPTIDIFTKSDTTSVRRGHGIYSYLFTSDGNIWDIIKLPAGLPKAELLNQNKNFIDQLYQLFTKYIKTGSMHEINIPYPQRQAITNVFANLTGDENECNLFNLIDEPCIEIMHLMAHSYSRFASNIELNNKLRVLQRINSDDTTADTRSNTKNGKEDMVISNLPVIRNGESYTKLRESYNLDDIEVWPFYI